MDEQTLSTVIKTALHEEVQTLLPKIDEKVTAAVKPIAEKVEALERQAVRYDADGKRFKWAGGESPTLLRHAGVGDSKPLLISNIWRALLMGGQGNAAVMQQVAGEELAVSHRLMEAGYGGYAGISLGAMLFPLDPSLIMEPINAAGEKVGDLGPLRRELMQRMRLPAVDPGELAWTVRKFPKLAADLGIERKDLQLGDDTLGGYLIPITQAGTVFDLFRARSTVLQAGATTIPLPPSGNITYPRLTSDPSFAWADPDSTTDATTSNIGLGVVRLIAKALRGYVTIPNDLIRYSSPAVEALVRAALAAKGAVEFDDALLQAAGSSLQPKGLINYPASTAEIPAVGKITLHVATTVGSNGNTFEPEDVLKIIGLYFTGNDPDAPTGWIMRPLMWTAIANRRADAVTAADAKGPFMFWTSRGQLGAQVPEALGGYPVFTSSKVSKTRAKGSGTDLTYGLFGNFARLLVGLVGVIELAVSEHVKFLQDKTIIRAVLRGDGGPSHEQSFVFTDTLLES